MNKITGSLIAGDYRFGIVAGRFNEFITESLLSGAEDILLRHGIPADYIDCVWVPGAFEIPTAAKVMLDSKKYDAIITLGAVIRGATPHFDIVAGECAGGVSRLATEYKVPVIFGVLTVDTIEQAIERAGTKAGNKGAEAAITALEMINLLQQL